jgi:hypothetical protein
VETRVRIPLGLLLKCLVGGSICSKCTSRELALTCVDRGRPWSPVRGQRWSTSFRATKHSTAFGDGSVARPAHHLFGRVCSAGPPGRRRPQQEGRVRTCAPAPAPADDDALVLPASSHVCSARMAGGPRPAWPSSAPRLETWTGMGLHAGCRWAASTRQPSGELVRGSVPPSRWWTRRRSIFETLFVPAKAMAVRSSWKRMSIAWRTPASPAAASP